MGSETTKTCSSCGEEKALEAFYRRRDSPDGHQAICIDCESKRKRKRDDATLRVSPEVRDHVNEFAEAEGITQREAADLLIARALL